MFLAIINDTYSEVKEETSNDDQSQQIGTIFKNCLRDTCRRLWDTTFKKCRKGTDASDETRFDALDEGKEVSTPAEINKTANDKEEPQRYLLYGILR